MTQTPMTAAGFEKMVQEWAKFISFHETALFIWPPKSGPQRRIIQFLQDIQLQKRLLSKAEMTVFLHIDANDEPQFSVNQLYAELYTQLARYLDTHAITTTHTDPILILDELKNKEYEVVIFACGMDEMLRNGNLSIIKELAKLHEQYKNMSLLSFVASYFDEEMTKRLFEKSALVSNIHYKALYTREDSDAFFDYIADLWGIQTSPAFKEEILDFSAGKFGLIKNALRILRHNPTLSSQEVIAHPSMQSRIKAVLEALPEEMRKLLSQLASSKYVYRSEDEPMLDYLLNIGFIQKNSGDYVLVAQFLNDLALYPSHEALQSPQIYPQLHVLLSSQEKRTLTGLLLNLNQVVSREVIAEYIWEEDADDKYSNWAIDQIMHRLREKIDLSKAPYALVTRKGLGFMLTAK